MSASFRTLLTNLDVIGNIKPGDKIYTKKDGSLETIPSEIKRESVPKDFWDAINIVYTSLTRNKQAMSRWYNNESKETTWDYLERNIELAIDYSTVRSKEEYKHELISKLENVKNGLENLKKTYVSESSFVAKLETLNITINTFMSNNDT